MRRAFSSRSVTHFVRHDGSRLRIGISDIEFEKDKITEECENTEQIETRIDEIEVVDETLEDENDEDDVHE